MKKQGNPLPASDIEPLAREGVHDKALSYLATRPRGTILDIPTGMGALAQELFRMGFAVTCCDIDPSQFRVEGLKVERGDLNGRLPFSDEAFDYVCFLEGLEHTENPYNALREVGRVLKPTGTLVLSTPNYLNIERRLKFLVTGFFTKPVSYNSLGPEAETRKYGLHVSPIGYTLVRFVLEQAGLTIESVTMDRPKPKQRLLKPLVWLIRLANGLRSAKDRKRYWLDETTSSVILEGGNTLIITARKTSSALP
jgi:SAM-dependent methyltransferase